jgi:hypothetical protein
MLFRIFASSWTRKIDVSHAMFSIAANHAEKSQPVLLSASHSLFIAPQVY